MATQPQSKLDIPEPVREFAEKSVDQAAETFGQMMNATQQAVSSLESSTSNVQAGATEFGKQTLQYAEQNITMTLDFARKLVRARDLEEIMELQAKFVEGQIAKLSDHTRTLTETASKFAAEQAKQTTPKKG